MAKQEKGGAAAGKKKKKNVVVEAFGQAHIRATFNNLIISLTNNKGEVISWSSAGKMGFRGSKKNTPYAGQVSAEEAAREAFDMGLRKVIKERIKKINSKHNKIKKKKTKKYKKIR